MNTYLILKTIHIMSSVLLVGTGFGSAFYLFFTHRIGSVDSIATVGRLVVRADWWFTTPTVIIQPITGIWMAHLAGWPLDTPWILTSLGLYALAGLCWLPVVWLQIRMAHMSRQAREMGAPLPVRYRRYQRWWESLGYPAFIAMVGVFALMVLKPPLW
jgi:uncharacterized membrane protein